MGNRASWFPGAEHKGSALIGKCIFFKSRYRVSGRMGVMLGTVIEKLDVYSWKQE